jgi:Na+/H+ antiporter NhaC
MDGIKRNLFHQSKMFFSICMYCQREKKKKAAAATTTTHNNIFQEISQAALQQSDQVHFVVVVLVVVVVVFLFFNYSHISEHARITSRWISTSKRQSSIAVNGRQPLPVI